MFAGNYLPVPASSTKFDREAVQRLAASENKSALAVVIDAIGAIDAQQERADTSVVFDLVRQLTGRSAAELSGARTELEKLATTARQPILRQIGFASLVGVDHGTEPGLETGDALGRRAGRFRRRPAAGGRRRPQGRDGRSHRAIG